jgi:hypothetical protein
MKRLINASIVYGVLGLIGGVFYREFIKLNGFSTYTSLSVVHTHYFMLGMMFFLILALLEMNLHFMNDRTKRYVFFYHLGLNLTVIMLMIRGVIQVVYLNSLTTALNVVIAGIAGIGHLILGISLIMILISIKNATKNMAY